MVSLHDFVCTVCETLKSRGYWDPSELELQAVVCFLICMIRTINLRTIVQPNDSNCSYRHAYKCM